VNILDSVDAAVLGAADFVADAELTPAFRVARRVVGVVSAADLVDCFTVAPATQVSKQRQQTK